MAALLRAAPATGQKLFERAYAGIPSEVRQVRANIASVSAGCPVVDELVLIVSELAANAVVHSKSGEWGGAFTVRAEIHDTYAWVEVEDQGGDWTPHGDDDADEHGRGLTIVAAIAGDGNWGIEGGGTPQSCVVWARLGWHQDQADHGKEAR